MWWSMQSRQVMSMSAQLILGEDQLKHCILYNVVCECCVEFLTSRLL